MHILHYFVNVVNANTLIRYRYSFLLIRCAILIFCKHFCIILMYKVVCMDSLNKDKLNLYKEKKGLSNKKMSDATGLPISSVDKIFSGSNKNPTLDTLKKIADILNCAIDDFIDYDNEPLAGYYADRETAKIAKVIKENKALLELMNIASELSDKDIKLVTTVVKRLKKK